MHEIVVRMDHVAQQGRLGRDCPSSQLVDRSNDQSIMREVSDITVILLKSRLVLETTGDLREKTVLVDNGGRT